MMRVRPIHGLLLHAAGKGPKRSSWGDESGGFLTRAIAKCAMIGILPFWPDDDS
jgi:hypothetical protein